MTPESVDPGSFRDPDGFVFQREGSLLRQVNHPYRDHYDRLMGSGLYEKLTAAGLLIPHAERAVDKAPGVGAYRLLEPQRVEFISYPYEWCFGQLKDAALTTLAIQKEALEHGMTLKDASAFNIQFVGGKPLLIDTLSFECYKEGSPWIAYRQFCQHFLAPLALVSRVDPRLLSLLRSHIDGVPLDLASRLLPRRTWLRLSLAIHLHFHASAQRRYADADMRSVSRSISKLQMLGLIDNLESAIRRLDWRPEGTAWADYYSREAYEPADREHKTALVGRFLERLAPARVLDLGANTGVYSRQAAARGIQVVACDSDFASVELNYRECVKTAETHVLPLVIDLTNPSPSLGWEGRERASLAERATTDAVLALALVHHLAIGNNVPLPRIATFFRTLADGLIVEFVPKSDSQVKRLLRSREDVFADYSHEKFEAAFGERYSIEERQSVGSSGRSLYLMRGK